MHSSTSPHSLASGALQGHSVLKPHRPRSAYNWFFQRERSRLSTRLDGSTTTLGTSHDNIGYTVLVKKIAKAWKNLSPEERAEFDDLAMQDQDRYQREMEVWRQYRSSSSTLPVLTQHAGDPADAVLMLGAAWNDGNRIGTAYVESVESLNFELMNRWRSSTPFSASNLGAASLNETGLLLGFSSESNELGKLADDLAGECQELLLNLFTRT